MLKLQDVTAINIPSPPLADTRLSGTRLLIARSVWVALALLSVGLYITSSLVYYLGLHGFQVGVYERLISTSAPISGYSAIVFHYSPCTGVGLASMRERAEELGGTWELAQGPAGGTSVHVQLPTLLPPETPDRASGMPRPGEEAS